MIRLMPVIETDSKHTPTFSTAAQFYNKIHNVFFIFQYNFELVVYADTQTFCMRGVVQHNFNGFYIVI